MEFALSPDQKRLQNTIRRVLQRELRPLVREYESREAFPVHLLPTLGEAGLLSLSFPPQYGGRGGHLEVALLTEEIARLAGGVCSGVLTHCIGARIIFRFGTPQQIERFLMPALQGSKVCAIAITEPDHGSDVAGLETEAVREGDSWRLRGHKMFITGATHADIFIVMCRTGQPGKHGISMVLVEKDSPGLIVDAPLKKLGWHSSDTTPVHFDDCLVPAENLLGLEGRGFYQQMEGFIFERVIMAAMGVGASQCALDGALSCTRVRGPADQNQPRSSTIGQRLADMATQVEIARLLTYWAARRADQDSGATREAAAAKLFASEVALRVAAQSVGVLGGAGLLTVTDVARVWSDVNILTIGGGTSEIMRNIIARTLGL